MWTNINGKTVPEKEFAVNHFVLLMPLFERVGTDSDLSFDMDLYEETKNHSLSDSMLDVIHNLEYVETDGKPV